MSRFTDLLDNISSGNIKDGGDKAIQFDNVDGEILSTERFRYPDMGDFYLNAVDDPYYKRFAEALEEIKKNEPELDINLTGGEEPEYKTEAINYFIEEPPYAETDLGDKPEDGVIWMKAQVKYESEQDKKDAIRMGYLDGDTIKFHSDTIDVGGDENVKNALVGTLYKEMEKLVPELKPKELEMRTLGMNAPEVAHWALTFIDEKDHDSKTKSMNYNEIEANTKGYVILRNKDRNRDIPVNVFKREDTWYEYRLNSNNNKDGKIAIEYLTKMEETDPARIEDGKRASLLVQNLLDASGGEVYFLVDRVSLNQKSAKYPTKFEGVDAFSVGFVNEAKYAYSQMTDYNRFKYTGYNQWGMDTYGRWMGAAYVKVKGNFINLAKYIIAHTKETEVLPDYTSMPSLEAYGGSPSRKFNLASYNYEGRVLYDIHSTIARELDDRRDMQKAIFGMDFDKMKEFNVTIGDVTFFVPPTSIRVNQQTTHDRLPIIRGKGSMTKGSQKIQKMIELTIYFNEERGINGYPVKSKLPNGTDITYYMNGLRALISQFKFTPFLPIENDYINRILNIEAVTLANMQIVTNPSTPRLLTCILTMQEFDYLQYMPEIPVDLGNSEIYQNPFSTVFNFELMRWYYQRPLIRGNELRNISINHTDYIKITEGSKTALAPMDFNDSYFKIYIANEAHLDKMHQIKIQKMKYPNRAFSTVSENDKALVKDLSPIFNAYTQVEGNDLVIKAIDKLKAIPGPEENFAAFRHDSEKAFDKSITRQNSVGIWKKDLIGGDLKSTTYITEAFNDIIVATNTVMYEANVAKPLLNQTQAYVKTTEDKAILGVVYSINSEYMSDQALTVLLEQAEKSIITENSDRDVSTEGGAKKSFNQWIKSGHIVVEYAMPLKPVETPHAYEYGIVEDADKIGLHHGESTQYLATISSLNHGIENDIDTINGQIEDMKEDIDSNLLETLLYDEIKTGEVRIKNIACSYGNNLTQVGLNGTEGYAAQYLGGQDTVIELGIETTDEFSVGVLNGLPKLASHILTRYRLIMPSAPVKFESEITRLFGVCEVVVENVEVATVPGQPGLYQINMRLVSMDRTARSREGIRKVNEVSNGGVTSDDGRRDIRMRNYEELNTRFGRAELYPDLELPTIEDLNTAQFNFLRHKFDSTRTYPDPDFYFNYGHILQSEIYREAVLNTETALYDVKYLDREGEGAVSVAKKDYGCEDIEKSEKYENLEKACEDGETLTGYASSKKISKYIDNHIPVINMLDTSSSEDVWDIGEKIRVMLMEEPYAKMLNIHKESLKNNKPVKETEWLYEKLEGVRKARAMIEEYLSKPIVLKDTLISFRDKSKIKHGAKNALKECEDIFLLLGVKKGGAFSTMEAEYEKIVYAAACAKTGRKEYRKGVDKEDYAPDVDFIGYKVSSVPDIGGVQSVSDAHDIINAIEFGPFRTKMRTEDEIRKIIPGKSVVRRFKKETDNVNTYMFLLDPYYREYASLSEIETYKKDVAKNPVYAGYAFFRECLVWLMRLIDDNLFPNINFDILNEEFESELRRNNAQSNSETKKEDLSEEEADTIDEQIDRYLDFLDDSESPIDKGKMFLITALAIGEIDLYEYVLDRNFKGLNQLKISLTSTSIQFEEATTEHMQLRRFLFALVPAKVIDGIEDISIKNDDVMQRYRRSKLDRKYIEFADDPDIYTRHAFYDMCVHDMRGRMARAFPSYYIVLVDEGQEIGMYKLNDNFYNINSISEIQVHKSRRLPADTCRIVMSNLYHTFTQDDEDKVVEYEYSMWDIFNSITNPRKIYDKEQEKRLLQQPLNKVKLTPGTRIHVRMGYGANAATLPVVFNGKITEINAGDVMEVICQGDGIELSQPILDNLDADEVDNADKLLGGALNLFDNASSPKEILTELLTIRGEWWRKLAHEKLAWIKNPSRYGYINFGDINYTDVFKGGEAVQNIFEAVGKPIWGSIEDNVETNINTREEPKISIELMGKSFWDVLHICASATPDYIGAVASFGMRSTVFHGHPRYYYAYDYVKSSEGVYYEKRKPFQQYHIVTSYSDIIANNIKTDNSRIKTNAVGSFKAAGNTGFLGSRTNYTKRMFVDWDIYPENQKSMVYDTQYYDKGIPMSFFIGKGVQWLDRALEFVTGEKQGTGWVQNGYPIANRMTQNALKESIKDMYTGDIVMLGIPSLKPHDRLQINDIYENMSGQVLVESVTHSLTVDTGLTSTVVPDCISTIDDQFERGTRNVFAYIYQSSMVGYLAVLATSHWITKIRGVKPIHSFIGYGASKIAATSGKSIAKVGEMVGSSTTKGAAAAKWAAGLADDAAKVAGKVATGAAIGNIPGAIAAVLWVAVEAGLTFMIGATTNRAMQEALKNGQVLTIFPLFQNGKVLTAGLNGSVGLCYGSTNFNKLGTLEKAFAYLDTSTNDLSWGWNALINVLVGQSTQDAAHSLAMRAIEGEYPDEDTKNEIELQDAMKAVGAREASKIHGFEKLLVSPRIQDDEEKAAMKYTKIMSIYGNIGNESIEAQQRIVTENTYILNDTELDKMINKESKGFFKTIWDESPTTPYVMKTFYVRGNQLTTKAFTAGEGSTISYDLPFLKDETISVLRIILAECKKIMFTFEPEKEVTNEHSIMLMSALIIGGEKRSLNNTGYCFLLEASNDETEKALVSSLNNTMLYVKEEYENGRSVNAAAFKYFKKRSRSYEVWVYPPDLGV